MIDDDTDELVPVLAVVLLAAIGCTILFWWPLFIIVLQWWRG